MPDAIRDDLYWDNPDVLVYGLGGYKVDIKRLSKNLVRYPTGDNAEQDKYVPGALPGNMPPGYESDTQMWTDNYIGPPNNPFQSPITSKEFYPKAYFNARDVFGSIVGKNKFMGQARRKTLPETEANYLACCDKPVQYINGIAYPMNYTTVPMWGNFMYSINDGKALTSFIEPKYFYSELSPCNKDYNPTNPNNRCLDFKTHYCADPNNLFGNYCQRWYASNPANEQLLDNAMNTYCVNQVNANLNDPSKVDKRCGCWFSSDVISNANQLPQCFDKRCAGNPTAYMPLNMRDTKCPSVLTCSQYINLSENSKDNILSNINMTQNCQLNVIDNINKNPPTLSELAEQADKAKKQADAAARQLAAQQAAVANLQQEAATLLERQQIAEAQAKQSYQDALDQQAKAAYITQQAAEAAAKAKELQDTTSSSSIIVARQTAARAQDAIIAAEKAQQEQAQAAAAALAAAKQADQDAREALALAKQQEAKAREISLKQATVQEMQNVFDNVSNVMHMMREKYFLQDMANKTANVAVVTQATAVDNPTEDNVKAAKDAVEIANETQNAADAIPMQSNNFVFFILLIIIIILVTLYIYKFKSSKVYNVNK